MHRYLCVFAVLALLACNSPVGVGGALDVSAAPTGLRIVNNSVAPAYVFPIESQTAALANWAPCVNPVECRGIAAGADTTVPYAAIFGYTPGASGIIVYWWHLVPESGGGFRADSIRAVPVSLATLSSNTVRVTGTVHYYDLEGGFWAVRGDDATTYDPMGGLPSAFQQDGLRVLLEAKIRSDVYSIHMAGPIVEIISLQRI